MPLSLAEFLAGLAFLVGTWGCAIAAAILLVRKRMDYLAGAPRVLAVGLLATGALIAAHLLPGLVGLLSRWSALTSAALLLAAAATVPHSAARRGPAPGRHPPDSSRLSWAVALAAVAALVTYTLAAAWTGTGSPSDDIDTLTFHLPNIARWIQTGSFWQIDQFNPLLASGNYPQNGDLVFLSTVLPFHSDALVRVVGVPFAALAALSVYAIAVEVGAPRATAVLLGAVFGSVPAFVFATYVGAKTDTVLLACLGAGLLFLIRHFRTGRRGELVLAGVGLGLAFGTKWYGVSGVPVVLAAWAAIWLWARRPWRALASNLAVLVVLVGLSGGFWLVRNGVESGNPLFPTKVAPLGVTIFDAPTDYIRECGGFTIASYLDDPKVLADYVLPDYRDNYGLPGALFACGLLLALALVVRAAARGRPPPARSAAAPPLLALAAIGLAAVYSVTPYSAFGAAGRPDLTGANTRWLLPALLAAAALSGWAGGRVGRWRRVFEVLALVAALDGIRRGFSLPAGLVLAAAAGLALLGAAGWALARVASARGWRSVAVVAPAAVLLGLAVSGVGYARQREFNAGRYATGDPVITWFHEHPEKRKVALAGVWGTSGLSPVLPAFGPRLQNEVHFAGHFYRGQLREYEDRRDFLDALSRGRYEVLVVGKEGYGGCKVPGREGDENAWARQAGMTRLAESGRLALYRVGAR